MPPHNVADAAAPDNAWRFSGFAIPTTTPVPDQLFDELMPRLAPAELVVTLYIIRRTFGFKKTSDTISLRQLTDGIITRDGRVLDGGTGLSKATVARALNSLEAKAVIIRARNKSAERGDEPTTYQLNFLKAVSQPETPPQSQPETPRVSPTRQGVSHQRDTQQTVRQQTVDHTFGTASQPRSKTSSGDPSKFRKGASQDFGQKQDQAIPEDPSRAAIASSNATLAQPRKAKAIVPPARTAAAEPRETNTLAEANTPRVTSDEREAIQRYLGDFAPELGDRAPFKTSVTRVSNIYANSGLTMAAFAQRLYSARSRTKERYASIRDRSKRFAYFCALLEEECGLREPPPEIAAAAAEAGASRQAPAAAGSRKSLAGRYAHLVQH